MRLEKVSDLSSSCHADTRGFAATPHFTTDVPQWEEQASQSAISRIFGHLPNQHHRAPVGASGGRRRNG